MESMETSYQWVSNRDKYNFVVEIKKHQQSEVFRASAVRVCKIVDDSECVRGNRKRQLTVVYFSDLESKERYLAWARSAGQFAYLPTFVFKEDDRFLGIGNPVGIPLQKWILKKNCRVWEYDYKGKYRKVGVDFALVGRWLGDGLHAVHMCGSFVGDLMQSTYVDEQSRRVTFLSSNDPIIRGQSVEDGIKDDLLSFKNFVDWVESNVPSTVARQRKIDIIQFDALYKSISNFPNDINGLQGHSFFLCHTPLFWEFGQRKAFCYAYYAVRSNDCSWFDSQMPFISTETSLSDSWVNQVSKMDAQFDAVLSFMQSQCSITRHHLIPFHRNSFEHYNVGMIVLSDEEIDGQLLNNFPYVIPRAYLEFFNSSCKSLNYKVSLLKEGLPTNTHQRT